MRKICFLSILTCLSIYVLAEDSIVVSTRPFIIDDMPFVAVEQDSMMYRIMRERLLGEKAVQDVDGYRVQIYSSNAPQTAKTEALQLQEKIQAMISQPVYVLYLSPFWKVRIGNFRSASEAETYKKSFIEQYPELQGNTYVVRDKVQIL